MYAEMMSNKVACDEETTRTPSLLFVGNSLLTRSPFPPKKLRISKGIFIEWLGKVRNAAVDDQKLCADLPGKHVLAQ
jgi:hypothetical protein